MPADQQKTCLFVIDPDVLQSKLICLNHSKLKMDVSFGRTDFPLDAKRETVLHFAKIYYSNLDCKVT